MVPGIGPARFKRLVETFGSAEAAWRADARALGLAGLEQKAAAQLVRLRGRLDPQAERRRLERLGIRVFTLEDPAYPPPLREIADPPPVLYLQGELAATDEWAVAVVGTRRATAYGRQAAERLVGELARAGVTIVSGLARGIDACAHRAALEAGGRTIAVLGNGLDQVYPPEHAALSAQVRAQGALVSEFPPGVPPDAANFPRRNRIISGLAVGTLVVEAALASGALITADFALEQGRDVYAVPGSIFSPASQGTNQLIKDGAKVVVDARDILEELNLTVVAQQQAAREVLPANETEARLMDLLGAEPVHIDELGRAARLPVGELASTLTMMELKGMVRQVGGMNYVRGRS
ncbi:MAG: DNA-protecting protein DprA [Chloroflexi bacterium]|nr:DNA-protecting protein DprA [Chloroflexota bacterium]